MAVKNTAQVVIDGKIITLGGYESEEYFQKVAAYMNNKISELSQMPGYSRQPMETIEEAKKAEQEALDQKNLLDGKVKELEKELDELLK